MLESWTVRCDREAASRLQELVDVWQSVIAAQQSNIVGMVSEAIGDGPGEMPKARSAAIKVYDCLVENDRARLRAICEMWGLLGRHDQLAVVRYARIVSGEDA